MRTMHLFLGLSAASLICMLVVDCILGPKAEFLNAFSVLERILGRSPAAGESLVAQKLGAYGEFAVALAVNLGIGGILTAVVRLFAAR